MRVHGIRWLFGWIIGIGFILLSGTAGFAEEDPCAKPIAPCKACHSPAAVRALMVCMGQPWVLPDTAKELKSPIPDSPKTVEHGKALYQTNCEGCHGSKGDGMGPVAVKFTLPAVDISNPIIQAQTDGELFWKISNGKGAMPAWSTILTDEDIWKLVTFVRTFQSRE